MRYLPFILFLSGCGASFTTTKVGPDRFAVMSEGGHADQDNYVKVLRTAYEACGGAGYNDYIISNQQADVRSLVVYVQCIRKNEEE